MPGPPPVEFIGFLPPPGDAVLPQSHPSTSASPQEPVPAHFIAAMTVRHAVFVDEQQVPAENELDEDDARSFHWVVYASVSSVQREGGRRGTDTSRAAVATIRLVPPPHAPHPLPGSEHKIDNAEGRQPITTTDARAAAGTRWHDGREPYAKLGRLSTLPAYRGLGLGRLIVESALDWASKHPLSIVPLPSATSTEAAKVRGGVTAKQEWKGLVLVHAQKDVERVWRKLGFERDDGMGVWIEEGIEHIGMWRRIPIQEQKNDFR
ncbi:MAG: hypothetical protein M1823_003370 [Watsoniomyces obsoletus]|nr:MAG: hypothetical protein M1823_003370 [Watsoniomyces obsoletus]